MKAVIALTEGFFIIIFVFLICSWAYDAQPREPSPFEQGDIVHHRVTGMNAMVKFCATSGRKCYVAPKNYAITMRWRYEEIREYEDVK